MKIRGRVVLSLVACLALTLGLAACGGEEGDLLGKWHSDGEMDTIEFRADGTMLITSDVDGSVKELRWSDQGSTIEVTEGESSRTAEYSIEGDSLTIQCSLEDEPWFYERVVE